MAEKKHYLDQVGLGLVWDKIKELVAKSTTTVVGTAGEVEVTAGTATTTGTTYTVGLDATAKASLKKADTALQIGDVTPVANATVTLDADGKGIATTVATIGTGDAEKTIAVNVNASAIAGAVYTAIEDAKVEYTFGEDATFSKVKDKEEYTVTVPLMKSVGGADAAPADYIVLTLDSSEFVKDSFLQNAAMGEGTKANTLILTMKLADGATKDIEVDLSKFIDTYTAGNGISIGDRVISVKTTTGGYLKADEDGLNIDSDQIAKGTSTTGKAATNLATKGYVDDAIATNVEAITEKEINEICVYS